MHSATQKQARSFNDPDPDLSWQRAFEACQKQGSALTANINGERWTLHPTGKTFKCGA